MQNDVKQWFFEGRATGLFKFGRAGNGTEQIGVLFEVLEGPWSGRKSVWYGSLSSEESQALVKEVLEAASGMTIASWWDFFRPAKAKENGALLLEALRLQALTLVFRQEADDDRPKLAFVNRIGIAMKEPMSGQEVSTFLRSLDGATRNGTSSRSRKSPSDEDLPPEAHQ